jgi:hypothetical protein
MLVAIMIISIGTLLHNAVTYYRHEPWEEYSTLIGDIELNTHRLLELSLVEYAKTDDVNVLNSNLNKWQSNLSSIYPNSGIYLGFTVKNETINIYGNNIDFTNGLAKRWNQSTSASSARANFTLGIASIGLEGYEFTAEAFLKVSIVSNSSSTRSVEVVVYKEDNMTISDLKKANFKVNSVNVVNMTASYVRTLGVVTYKIYYQGVSPPMIEVWDQRGIYVTAKP